MARVIDQNASTKVTAASTTVTFTAADIPANGVVAYIARFTGAGMTVGDLTRIRVKSGGQTIYDMDFAHYQAFIQRLSQSHYTPVAADTSMLIPFWLPDLENEDQQDLCQMPFGQPPTVELVIGAGGAAGTVQLGYIVSNVQPKLYAIALGSQMNIPASVNQARFPFVEPGLVIGLQLPTVGLTRFQAVLNGAKRIEIEGTEMLFFSQRWNQVSSATGITSPAYTKIVGPQSAPAGNSGVVLDTAAGFAGVANELLVHALRPQGVA